MQARGVGVGLSPRNLSSFPLGTNQTSLTDTASLGELNWGWIAFSDLNGAWRPVEKSFDPENRWNSDFRCHVLNSRRAGRAGTAGVEARWGGQAAGLPTGVSSRMRAGFDTVERSNRTSCNNENVL